MAYIEQPGSFYLGRSHSLSSGKTNTEAMRYDSSDLTTHAVCVGMTGSGKTGLCITLLEEAALNGIPAIVIDPKGDLGNLLLAFPNLQPSDFRPWIDPSEAARQAMSADEFAAKQAWSWRNGLSKWDQTPDRIRRYCDAAERIIFTPGSSAGIPITVLKSFHAPPPDLISDSDAFTERISSATSGLLALLGIDADPVRSREHIYLSKLFESTWRDGRDLDLQQLIEGIQRPPFEQVGVVDLESFYPAVERHKLAMSLNNLLASPAFASWMIGEPLDVQRLLYTPAGKPRLAIVSIAHLEDAQRMFFVTLLLNEIVSWVRTQPGTSSLRALLYMDEVFGFFPPLSNPPSKRPMLTLMKQARAYGLGCILATQNPVDLDYKGLSNAGTWFLGRLQTERDKARVIEGLEGASVEAGSNFNRQNMEAKLAALGKRVFLMNNVHNDAPIVFHTRWAMSYLCGPLTRGQIKFLMDPLRSRFGVSTSPEPAPQILTDTNGGPATTAVPPKPTSTLSRSRPILLATISEKFAAILGDVVDGSRMEYRPAIVGTGKAHFLHAKDIDAWRDMTVLRSIGELEADDFWEGATNLPQPLAMDSQPVEHAEFCRLPSKFAQEQTYKALRRELAEHIYRHASLQLWRNESLGVISRASESEVDFRRRIKPVIDACRDADRNQVDQRIASKLASLEGRIASARTKVSAQKWQFWTRATGLLGALVDGVMRLKGVGRRGRPRSASTAMRGMATERGQQESAQATLDRLLSEKEALTQLRDKQLADVDAKFDSSHIELEPYELKPRKSDIEVDAVALVWLPWQLDAQDRAEPLYGAKSSPSTTESSASSKPAQSTATEAAVEMARG